MSRNTNNNTIFNSMRETGKLSLIMALVMVICFLCSYIVSESNAIDAFNRGIHNELYKELSENRWWFFGLIPTFVAAGIYSFKKAYDVKYKK